MPTYRKCAPIHRFCRRAEIEVVLSIRRFSPCAVSRKGSGGSRAPAIDHAPGDHDDIANAVSGVVGAIVSGIGSAWMNLIWD